MSFFMFKYLSKITTPLAELLLSQARCPGATSAAHRQLLHGVVVSNDWEVWQLTVLARGRDIGLHGPTNTAKWRVTGDDQC